MKLVSTLALTFATSAAMACPNLTGTYSCAGEDGPEKLSISQQENNGTTVYTIHDSEGEASMPADNVEYPFDEPGENMSGTVRFVCEGDLFNTYMKGQVTDESKKVVQSWEGVRTVRLDEQSNLEVSAKGTFTQDGQSYPIDDKSVCLREQ